MGRRLFWRIYLTLLASLVALTILGGALWRMSSDPPPRPAREFAVRMLDSLLPPADAPTEEQAAALGRIARAFGGDVALHAPDGTRLALIGAELPAPRDVPRRSAFFPARPGHWLLALPDGRQIVARLPRPPGEPRWALLRFLAIGALAVALAAYPVVRRLTRRLEKLRGGVESWGAGDLSARIPAEGRDEVAVLARSFNEAADRIEKLVEAHKTLLANVSHELRSPLARLRLGIEMLPGARHPALAAELARNLAELDQLVEEVLLTSRLEHVAGLERSERVDLLALAAEEGARADAAVSGRPMDVVGDPRLLRRLVRNLLDNAGRHGAPPVEVEVGQEAGGVVRLEVRDAGRALAGLSAEERAALFEPFRRAPGAPEAAGSWGLGLSLVRRIAERHGGHAWCEARADGGARFVVELPDATPAYAGTMRA